MRAFALRDALARCATRRVGLGALAGIIASVAGLVWRHGRLGGLALLDARGWYTPPEAAALFDALDALDANARLVYAATALTIDMVFPVAYGLLFAIVLLRLFRAPLFVLPLALAVSAALPMRAQVRSSARAACHYPARRWDAKCGEGVVTGGKIGLRDNGSKDLDKKIAREVACNFLAACPGRRTMCRIVT